MASILGFKFFDLAELEEATKGFNFKYHLGEGGFGTVYYGKRLKHLSLLLLSWNMVFNCG